MKYIYYNTLQILNHWDVECVYKKSVQSVLQTKKGRKLIKKGNEWNWNDGGERITNKRKEKKRKRKLNKWINK